MTTTSLSDSATPQRRDAETQTMSLWTDDKKFEAVDEVLNYLGLKGDNPRDRDHREAIKEDVKKYIAGIAIYYPFSAVHFTIEACMHS